jgi:signal recognition particle receptor subunit beta
LSGQDYLATDREVTDASRERKTHTTVAMDFGRLTFEGGLSLQLLGTPGQQRFDVMWEILAKGMMGFILLIDPAAPEAIQEAKHILTSFRRLRDVPSVVGVSHLEGTAAEKRAVLGAVRKNLSLPPAVPVVACDARVKADAKKTLVKLLGEILVRSGSERAAAG